MKSFLTRHRTLSLSGTILLIAAASVPLGGSTTRESIRQPNVTTGLVVQVGCSEESLSTELREAPHCLVHGLDTVQARVESIRRHLHSRGLLGRARVDVLRGSRLPYADDLVNRLVAEELGSVPMEEVFRVLVPNGVAYIGKSGEWTRHVKPRSRDLDDWTHWLYDASGNAVGRDCVVGPPRRFQWMAGPLWSRHHNSVPSVSAMVSSAGRLFTIIDEGPPAMAGTTPDKWFLTARDAFNGLELWRKPMQEWGWKAWSTVWDERFNQPNNVPKRLVAVGDRVYVTLGFNSALTALDAATGNIVHQYEGSEFTDEILYQDGCLILSINKGPQAPGEVEERPPVRKHVAVYDAKSGEQLWKAGDFVGNSTKTGPIERVTHLLLAALDDQVFLLDGDAVVSLDLKTGRQLWRSPRPSSPEYTSRYDHRMSEMCTLVATDKVILLCQLEPIQKRIGWRVIKARLQAYDTKTGEPLWQYRCGNWGHFCVPDVFVNQGLVWVHDKKSMSIVALEPTTGVERRRLSTEKALDNGHHHRCYRNKATEQFLVTSYRGLEFLDWDSGSIDRNHWVRGTCRFGVVPCNGLVYSTPHPCDCYISSKLNGFHALAPADRSLRVEADLSAKQRLIQGAAYGTLLHAPTKSLPEQGPPTGDWPMYRHNAARSGCANGKAPSALSVVWDTRLSSGRLSASVVAEGRVLVAAVDDHTIHALDADSGKRRWDYVAAGRIDTPPTLVDGRAVFGCRNGWVYCLRASDGTLIWRFLAASEERLVVAQGDLESAWPVHGSVLVQDGKVYTTAGRSSFLDGGLRAYCLDLATGKVLVEKHIAHAQDMSVDQGRIQSDDTGVVSDLLVHEDDGVYMRHLRLFGRNGPTIGWGNRVAATAGMLDDSWFNRTVWLVDGRDHGELLVHDDASVYAVRAHKSRGHGQFIMPGTHAYRVVATDRVPRVPRKPGATTNSVALWPRPKKTRWSVPLPIRVTAMATDGETLLCAGTPDGLDAKEPWAAYEGRRGGTVYALTTADGTKRSQLHLEAAPVYDGMAVANGRLYLSSVDGTLRCIADSRITGE